MKPKKIFFMGLYGYFIAELIIFALLSGCGSQAKTMNETTTTTSAIQTCPITTTTICPSCPACNNNTLEIKELQQTIKDLKGYAYNGWNMANSTLEELNRIQWNASDTTKYGVNSTDIDRLYRVKTLTEGMQHSFQNIRGW